MKALFAAFGLASCVFLAACADEREHISGQELGQKFQRGVSGEGTLGPMDRTNDPYVKHDVPQNHP